MKAKLGIGLGLLLLVSFGIYATKKRKPVPENNDWQKNWEGESAPGMPNWTPAMALKIANQLHNALRFYSSNEQFNAGLRSLEELSDTQLVEVYKTYNDSYHLGQNTTLVSDIRGHFRTFDSSIETARKNILARFGNQGMK